jgi:hypothetical protein
MQIFILNDQSNLKLSLFFKLSFVVCLLLLTKLLVLYTYLVIASELLILISINCYLHLIKHLFDKERLKNFHALLKI